MWLLHFLVLKVSVAFYGLLKAVLTPQPPMLLSVGDVLQGPPVFMLISMFCQYPTFYVPIFL